MAKKLLIDSFEATARGAIDAGCRHYFGYPITPQSAIPEYMSRELPKIGGVFLQSECETASICMVQGAAATGVRAMTSTSSPGAALMQECISFMAAAEIPGVIVDVVRGGPGIGTTQSAQTDYLMVTKGGGHGGYRCIVLAPASSQEAYDFIQLAFHLADKYRVVVWVLSDYLAGNTAEPVELRTLEFGSLPEKAWALKGTDHKAGKADALITWFADFVNWHQEQQTKYQKILDSEVRYETDVTGDAELLLVAYGSTARMAQEAVRMGRAQGLRLGLLRPITLWPFPAKALREEDLRADKVLVIEDSQGQMVEDVEAAVQGRVPVHLLGMWGRHLPSPAGIIYPNRILAEVNALL